MRAEEVIRCSKRLGRVIRERDCDYSPKEKACEECKNEKLVVEDLLFSPFFEPFKDLGIEVPPETIILSKKIFFSTTQNPVHALEAFLFAREKKINYPDWVMDWLYNGLKSFYESNGEKNLEQLFGFKRGKGQSPSFRQIEDQLRYNEMCREIIIIRSQLDAPIEVACKMVISKRERMGQKGISWRTLFDYYTKNSEDHYEPSVHYIRRHVKFTAAQKEELLKFFPEGSYDKTKLRMK